MSNLDLMDIACLWIGRAVVIGGALCLIPCLYWIAFRAIRKLIDPTQAFWEFYMLWLDRKRNPHA